MLELENLASAKPSGVGSRRSALCAGHGWPSVPVAKTRTRMFEVSAPPWMARCRDGEKGPSRKYVTKLYFLASTKKKAKNLL